MDNDETAQTGSDRGEPISAAKTIYEAKPDDIGANILVFHGPYGVVPIVQRQITFFSANYVFVKPAGATIPLPLPSGADIKGVTGGRLVFTLRDDWTPQRGGRIAKGSLVAFPVLAFAQEGKPQPAAVLYTPGPRAMIAQDVSAGRDAVYAPVYENVIGSIHQFRFTGGKWSDTTLALPKDGSTGVVATNDWGAEAYFTFQSFTQPPTLYQYGGAGAPNTAKSEPERFDPKSVTVTQNWATSRDGTKVPYFLIRPRGATGPLPTILYGYGGFELSLNPWYWNDGHRLFIPPSRGTPKAASLPSPTFAAAASLAPLGIRRR